MRAARIHNPILAVIFALISLLPADAPADFVDQWNSVPCVMFYPAVAAARRSNCEGERMRFGSVGHVSYNSQGLPDRDYPPRAPAGVKRVLVVGGSVWAGSGVDQDKAIPRRFESELKAAGFGRVEVINATTEGFSAWQNAILIRDFLEKYNPDFVLFHEFEMYPFQELSEWSRLMKTPQGLPVRYSPWADEFPAWIRDYLAEHQGTYHAVTGSLMEWARVKSSWRVNGNLDVLLKPTLTVLGMMKEASEEAGARFFVVVDGPDFTSKQLLVRGAHLYALADFSRSLFMRNFSFSSAEVKAKLESAGFRVLSLADGMAARADKVLKGDYHYDTEGSLLYGRDLAKAFAAEAGLGD